MVKDICEHSIDVDLLNSNGWVLDFGCGVDFLFSEEMAKMGMNVISIDPNPKIKDIPSNEKIEDKLKIKL